MDNLAENSVVDYTLDDLHTAQEIACEVFAPGDYQEARWQVQQSLGQDHESEVYAMMASAGRSACPTAWQEALDTTTVNLAEEEAAGYCTEKAGTHPLVDEVGDFNMRFIRVDGQAGKWSGEATTEAGIPVRCVVADWMGSEATVAFGEQAIMEQRMDEMFGPIE